jgi:hypothetical protein
MHHYKPMKALKPRFDLTNGQSADRRRGHIKIVFRDKGFAFISQDDSETDAFLHFNKLSHVRYCADRT